MPLGLPVRFFQPLDHPNNIAVLLVLQVVVGHQPHLEQIELK